MDLATRQRYLGFSLTPPLWENKVVFPFQQIELPKHLTINDDSVVFKNKRLGKLVEEFVFHQLKGQASVSWICDNLQIQDNRRTVGEIDALYFNNTLPVHLEIAYKFYLYDTMEDHQHPLSRKDNLFYKLGKLQSRQFPLLHNPLTRPYLDRYNLKGDSIEQRLCFRAQLFVPYQNNNINFGDLNPACVAGSYTSHREIAIFKGLEFYIPAKLDWLIAPHLQVEWIDFQRFREEIGRYVMEERSPLVWVKHGTTDLRKWFVTFW